MNESINTRLVPCPHCGAPLDGITAMGDMEPAQALPDEALGYSVCAYCREPLTVLADYTVRACTPAEYAEALLTPEVQRIREAVARTPFPDRRRKRADDIDPAFILLLGAPLLDAPPGGGRT